MPVSSGRKKNTKKKVVRDNNKSRATIEQEALEGRGREIYRYLKKNYFVDLVDKHLLYIAFLWLYSDPKKELSVEEFMDLTEPEIHARFDRLSTKSHLQVLSSFEKVIDLYAIEDNSLEAEIRYAI